MLNIVTGTKEHVPWADIFITGFVCQSVPSENNDGKNYKNCIEENSGQTGETFSGIMDYVRKHHPSVVPDENVRGITHRSDGEEPIIHQVVDLMKRAGYHFDFWIPDTSHILIPQSRNRCWMVGLRRDTFSACAMEDIFDMIDQMKQKTWA